MKIRFSLPTVVLLLLFQYAYCQTGGSVADSILSKTERHFGKYVTEAAYLHFDKPYYLAGDTVYFAAYVTMGEKHTPSTISGVLHVDLVNALNKPVQSLKLPLASGFAAGDFALPDSLPKGTYHIVAYTNWMRNDNNRGSFDRAFSIGSLKTQSAQVNTPSPNNTKPDLQFFPESGTYVYGINSKVAFKAIGANGKGINFKGKIIDSENKDCGLLASTHLGMGYFLLAPKEGETYRAQIKYENGLEDIVTLPKPATSGIILSVNNDSIPTTTVNVLTNKAFYDQNKNKEFLLFIYSQGKATTVNFKLDSMATKFEIMKRHLQTGVARAALFSSDGTPICERLFFVQNYDQLRLNVKPDQLAYTSRAHVKINLQALDAAQEAIESHFSVSVVDENKLPVDENSESTIITHYLLTADLNGYIEDPNYYFKTYNDKTAQALDLVMLTHGYSKFEWQEVLNHAPLSINYEPETGLSISGITKGLWGKPVNKGSISLFSPLGGPILTQETGKDGSFKFTNLVFQDTTAFILSASKANGSNSTQITYKAELRQQITLNSYDEDIDSKNYITNARKQEALLNKLGLGKGTVLKEVKIKASKPRALVKDTRYGPADQVIPAKWLQYGSPLEPQIKALIHMPYANTKPPLIVLNGVEMPIDFPLEAISAGSVKSVEVFKDIKGMDYDGVLAFTITAGLQEKDIVSTGILPIKLMGFYKARTFYTPKYESNENLNALADMRTTIFWKPDITTDKDGNASFDFYNAEGNSTYKVSIEGIDAKGRVGQLTYRFKVE